MSAPDTWKLVLGVTSRFNAAPRRLSGQASKPCNVQVAHKSVNTMGRGARCHFFFLSLSTGVTGIGTPFFGSTL